MLINQNVRNERIYLQLHVLFTFTLCWRKHHM